MVITHEQERNGKMPPRDGFGSAFCDAAVGLDDGYLVTQGQGTDPLDLAAIDAVLRRR